MKRENLRHDMRIALVMHQQYGGGIARVVDGLVSGLLESGQVAELGLFTNSHMLANDPLYQKYADHPLVTIHEVVNARLMGAGPLEAQVETEVAPHRGLVWRACRALFHILPRVMRTAVVAASVRGARIAGRAEWPWYMFKMPAATIEQLDSYDVVHFVYPYFVRPFRLRSAMVGTFHDLHFVHFPDAYPRDMLRIAQRQTRQWLRRADRIVCSTDFIRAELEAYCPTAFEKIQVVRLAPYAANTPHGSRQALSRFAVADRYIIYPANRNAHKNIGSLLQAQEILKSRGEGVQLVITGGGTQLIADGSSEIHAEDEMARLREFVRGSSLVIGEDVLALGYVTDEEVDCLTRNAALVVSTSLYEAGCGPALDAWQAGVPVAFSRIPPFLEQMETLNVSAWVFDPLDPVDIANTIGEALRDSETSALMVKASKAAIASLTWGTVAQGYLSAYRCAIDARRDRS